MCLKFHKDPLAVEQKNYLIKIINVYTVYDLDAWSRNPTDNFKFKNCLFEATNLVEKSNKVKYVHSGYRITFDYADEWSFDDGTAENVIISSVDNGSSSHSDNRKNTFLVFWK